MKGLPEPMWEGKALSCFWMSSVMTEFGINHYMVQNGKLFASKESGDAGACELMSAEHSLRGCLANGFTLLPTLGKCYRIADKMVSMQTMVLKRVLTSNTCNSLSFLTTKPGTKF